MNSQSINVVVQGNKIEVSSKLAEVSDYMHGLLSLGFDEDEEIEVERVSLETFQEILEFYTMNNFEQVPIKHPIDSNDIENFITQKNAQFINRHPIDSIAFKNLYKSAEFLGCRNLIKVCAARFACFLYFEDSKEFFMEKLKQLNIPFKIEFEDNQKFKKLYPFMNK